MGIENQTSIAVDKDTRSNLKLLAEQWDKPVYQVVKEMAEAALQDRQGKLSKTLSPQESVVERGYVRMIKGISRLLGVEMPSNLQTMAEVDEWSDGRLAGIVADLRQKQAEHEVQHGLFYSESIRNAAVSVTEKAAEA